jgi:pimeloyl-ACP methyl ester carboxylesterase
MTEAATLTPIGAWQDQFIEVLGLRLGRWVAGHGEPLVLLPDDIGTPGWLPFHEGLASARTVHLLSHPGFGRSDRPEWARSVRDLAAIEAAALRRLGLQGVPVVGLGLGGWLAAEIAVADPSLFKALVLVAPFGLKPAQGEIYDQFLGRGPAYARAGFADQQKFAALHGEEPDLDTLEQWEINREMTARVAWAPYLFSQSLPHLLPLIEAPALVVWGAQDRIIPASTASQWAELLLKARVEVIEDCGHRVDVEQPAALAEAIASFLEER